MTIEWYYLRKNSGFRLHEENHTDVFHIAKKKQTTQHISFVRVLFPLIDQQVTVFTNHSNGL